MSNMDIAVIGMAFRFPGGVKTEQDFWRLLQSGHSAITEIPASRWATELYQDSERTVPGRSVTFKAGILDGVYNFDAQFFRISPKEAEWMDPQQRFLLEVTYECLENANISLSNIKGSGCGVYTGISSLDYGLQSARDPASITPHTMTGNTLSIAANRISYVFDLHGPSLSLDTACSSSLVALHHACQAIRNSEVPCAFVAGAHMLQDFHSFIGFSKASMLSPTGTCYPFDKKANGYVRAEGVAVLLLKPLEHAVRDGNRIHAVIKGSGVNTDGSRKNGLTIPSAEAQSELMRSVLKQSGLKENEIDFIETHGTGTPVGDPIEAKAVSSVYAGNRMMPLPITSVKANVGHMEPMSGLVGLIKAIVCLKHGAIPRIPFEFEPNPDIDFDNLNLKCYQSGIDFAPKKFYCAGVNSFGFGGSNAHVLLQNYCSTDKSGTESLKESATVQKYNPPLFLSAKSRKSLEQMCSLYAGMMSSEDREHNYDILYNASFSRDPYRYRLAVTGTVEEQVSALADYSAGGRKDNLYSAECFESYNKICFVFNGNGSQYAGMGRRLYEENSCFAECFDMLSGKIEKYLDFALSDLMKKLNAEEQEKIIQNTRFAQPLIFAIQVSLCHLLKKSGIVPQATAGHSMGEIAAAYVAGKLDIDEAVKVICVRSLLQDRTRGMGRMAAVSVSPRRFLEIRETLLSEDHGNSCAAGPVLNIAAVNSDEGITVSGDRDSLDKLSVICEKQGIFFKDLNVDYPFHSEFMESIKDDVLHELAGLSDEKSEDRNEGFSREHVAFYSAVTGSKVDEQRSLNNDYWWHNIRDSVNFAGAVKELLSDGYNYFIEIGSNAILQRYLRELSKKAGADTRIGSTLLIKNDGINRISSVIMECHLVSEQTDRRVFFPVKGKFIQLPSYPWDQKFYIYKSTSEKTDEQRRIFALLGWTRNLAPFTWENILEPSKYRLLQDHVVENECVFAAADYIETVLEAASLIDSNDFKQSGGQKSDAHSEGPDSDRRVCLNIEYIDILNPLVFNGNRYKNIQIHVQPDYRKITLSSRDYLSEEEWLLNISGRVNPAGSALQTDQSEKFTGHREQTVLKTVTHDELYSLTAKVGLNFGEQFSLVEKIEVTENYLKTYIDSGSLQKFGNSGYVCADYHDYIIHPGVIDAGFQSLLALSELNPEKEIFLPVKFGRISIVKNSRISYIIASVKKVGARSILADFMLFNESDECVGILENCRFKKTPGYSDKTGNMRNRNISRWQYRADEIRHCCCGILPEISAKDVLDELESSLKTGDETAENYINSRKQWFSEILPLSEHSVLSYAYEAFKDIAWKNNRSVTDQSDYDLYKIKQLSFGLDAVNEQSLSLFYYLADVLIKHNLISEDHGIYTVAVSDKETELERGDDIVRYAYSLRAEALPHLLPLYRIGQALPELLSSCTKSGRMSALISDLQNYTADNGSILYLGMRMAVRNLIAYLINLVPVFNNKKLRILDLYSDKGILHEIMQEPLFSDKFEVVYASLSNSDASVSNGKELTAELKIDDLSIDFKDSVHDREKVFDLILVESLLHGTSNHFIAVKNLKKYLSASGMLAVIERFNDWSANLCSGINPLWWRTSNESSSSENDSCSRLKSPVYWKSLLNGCFGDVEIYRESAAGNYNGGLMMLLAVQNESSDNLFAEKLQQCSEKHRIAFICETKGNTETDVSHGQQFTASVLNKLAACGIRCDYLADYQSVSDFNDYDTVIYLSDCGLDKFGGELKKIIFGSGADIRSNEYSDDDSSSVSEYAQHITELSRIIRKNTHNVSLVVLTVNGSVLPASNALIIPQQTALIGLTRVIANEFSDLRIRNLDLSVDPAGKLSENLKLLADSLVYELTIPSSSDELVLTSNGSIAVKLNSSDEHDCDVYDSEGCGISLSAGQTGSKVSEKTERNFEMNHQGNSVYLDYSQPGRLKNLCWKNREHTELKPHDVEVSVKAAGLNFRDIMMTMGLVPDDVLEKGYSGPSLGLEFTGVVTGIGSDVRDYRTGDRVLGFGSACFSGRLVVPEYAIAAIPKNWSYYSAATVPIVFFTAWYAIHGLAHAEKGERILIHGAAGGVGIAAIQIASYLGLEVYATAGNSAKRDFLGMLGVRHIYNSRTLDFRDQILSDTEGDGVDICLNCLSGEAMRLSMSVLKPFGRFIELGKRDFVENTEIGLRVLKENITYFAVDADQLFKIYPERAKKVFHDVISSFADGKFSPLPFTVFKSVNVVDAFRLMQHGGHIGKIIIDLDDLPVLRKSSFTGCAEDNTKECNALSKDNGISCTADADSATSSDRESSVFSHDDTWLVTGGTGGFGFATAEYLISEGVRKVVLVSRNGVRDPEVFSRIEKLSKDQSIEIIVENCDVSDFTAVSALWDKLKNNGIHIDGIIHGAAVFADTMLNNITGAVYEKVLGPKLQGALNLHEISKNENLKFFVLYSSVAVAIGNIGQANYVAANSGLEGLTARRLKEGLPAACIEWGPIADTGYLTANQTVKKSLESVMGAGSLKSSEALRILPDVLSRGGIHVCADINWSDVTETIGRVPSRLHDLVRLENHGHKNSDSESILKLLEGKSKDEAVRLITETLISDIAETMGLGSDQISKDQDLRNLGLDSLMAMELIVSIERKTGTKLSVMMFQDNPTVQKLAEKIYSRICGSSVSDESHDGKPQMMNAVITAHVRNDDEESRKKAAEAVDSGGIS